MKKSKEFLRTFEIRMDLRDKVEKRWFWTAFVLLVLYVEFVIFGQNTVLTIGSGYAQDTIPRFSDLPLLLDILLAAAAVPLCFIFLLAVSKWKISGEDRRAKERGNPRDRLLFAAMVWVWTFAVFLLCLKAYWPGAFSGDSIDQYRQAYSGRYNNWHPVLHTWLFFRLPLQIFHGPEGIVPAQILWFSLAVAYLFYVLYASGCPKAFLICGWIYIVANPNTLFIMMIPWKDPAMTIFSTVMFAQLVRVYLTKGGWLKKWYNLAAFSVFAFLTMEVRHNAVLLVAPVFVILICFFGSVRKRTLLSALAVLLAHLLVQGPVFSLMKISLSDDQTVETMGLPMTVLSDIYVQDRSAFNAESGAFMDSLTAEENWGNYTLGNFNSIKWSCVFSHIEKAGVKNILRYTADAAMERPDLAWKAFCLLTGQVWQADGGSGWDIGYPGIADNPYGIRYRGDDSLRNAFIVYATFVSACSMKYLFRYTGVTILVLLLLAVGNLGDGNLCRSFLVLAPMAYDFGTMLLLSGPDFRFFHFNFVIVVPLIYLLLRRKGITDDGKN